MYCPYCHHDTTNVIDSRESEDNVIRRRRECVRCSQRYTTYERVEATFKVLKKDGQKEEYDRDKVVTGMMRACKKRPVTVEQLNKIADHVEGKLRKKGTPVIESTLIGALVMNELKKIDKVAYIRFASIYRDFADVKDFALEIKKIQ